MNKSQAIREARARKNLSLSKLADEIGVDPSTISRWESGRDFVTVERFLKTLKRLEISVDEFFGL